MAIAGLTRYLSGVVYHDDGRPLSGWIRAQDRYATIEARYFLAPGRVAQLNFPDRLWRKVVLAGPLMFFYLLFARGLLLDGWPGWLHVCQRTIAELLLSIRLLIEREKLERKNEQLKGGERSIPFDRLQRNEKNDSNVAASR